MEIGSAFVSLLPSAKGFGSKLNSQIGGEVDRSGRTAGGRFGRVFATASISPIRAIGVAAVGLFAVDKVKDFFASSIGEAREAQKVGALTTQVIKTTGGAANVSAKQIGNLATAISLKTGIDDEAIQSGANLLLTFTNVRNEVGRGNKVFNQATRLSTDMAAALGTDAKSAALQLGKALNDPAKGVTKLARSGVSFTEEQTKQIKAMQASGNILGAQKIILGEVSKEFGGAAAAQATAGDKMKVAWGNLEEQIGTALLPVLDKLEGFITSRIIPAVSSFVSMAGPALSQFSAFLAPFIAQVKSFFGGSGGSALTSFATSLKAQLLPVLQTAATTFQTVILPALTSLVNYVVSSLWPAFLQFVNIIRANVIPIIASFATFIYGTLYPAVVRIVTAIAQNLKPVFDQLVATFRGSVLPALQALLVKFREWQPTIQRTISLIVAIIGKILIFAAAVLGKVLPVVIRFAGYLISRLVPAIANVIGIAIRVIAKVVAIGAAFVDAAGNVAQFVAAVVSRIAHVIKTVSEIPRRVVAALGNLGTVLIHSGEALIAGFATGIRNKATEAYNEARKMLGKVKNLFPHSPAKEGPFSGRGWVLYSGRTIGQALAKGISDSAPRAVKAAFNMVSRIKDQIDTLVDSYKQLSESIASSFTNGLFDATNGSDFFSSLTAKRAELTKLVAAFKKLQGWGLSSAFLSNLFQSGNGALILDLASGSAAQARQDNALFGQVQGLAGQLGNAVATDVYGPQIVNRLDALAKAVDRLPHGLGGVINGTAAKGRKKGR